MTTTPAPWFVGGMVTGPRAAVATHWDDDEEITEIPISAGRAAVAWVVSIGESYEQLLPDARLIAAAPDLLAACRLLLDTRYSHWHRIADEGEPEPEDMQAARAAIAKAEGRQR